MSKRDADVALRGRVREVALQREVTSVAPRESNSAAEISRFASAFSKRMGLILCGIADEPMDPGAARLSEVAERDVRPHVGREVVQDAAKARDVRVKLGLPIVGLDLSGERVPREAEPLDERAATPRSNRSPGTAAVCAPNVPVAPLILPKYSAASTRRNWRRSRCASTASSLPSVVGVAVWPWVRESMATPAVSWASAAIWSVSDVAAGSHTSRTAPCTMSAYERLLMSSDVQAKCTSSLRRPRALVPVEAALDVVLNRLDVVDGLALDFRVLCNALGTKSGRDRAQQRRLVGRQNARARHRANGAQVNEPFHLNVEALAIQRGLGKVVNEPIDSAAVPAVERPQRDRRGNLGKRCPVSHVPILSRRTSSPQAPPARGDFARRRA